MAKDQSFAAKIAKGEKAKHIPTCPKCGTAYTPIRFYQGVTAASGVTKFNERHVIMCKCNEKEIYG